MRPLDVLIVGQGLAGTTLAWRLLGRDQRVMVVDPLEGPSASRVATGLLAPVGGKRLALAWRAAEAWPSAVAFYRQVQRSLGITLLHENAIVRMFVDAAQRDEFQTRREGPLADFIESGEIGLSDQDFHIGLSGFVAAGARLDVVAYLDASRKWLTRADAFLKASVRPDVDFLVRADAVEVPRLAVRARRVVLCCGLQSPRSTVVPSAPFEPAKGEVLTVTVPELPERRVVQRGVWLAPLGDDRFKVGATFHRDAVDDLPSEAGRQELMTKLTTLLKRSFAVVDHAAGVRPIVRGRVPVVGALPNRPRIGVFNGLGANGALWAPWVSDRYAEHLVSGAPLPAEIDVSQRFPG